MAKDISPVMEGIFEVGPPARLIGAKCPKCNKQFFPAPMVCPSCLGPVNPFRLPTEGKIYSFTVVRTRPPFGLPQPYAVAYIDLAGGGLRIIGLLDPKATETLYIDQAVTLKVGAIGLDRTGQPCLRYFFTPKRERAVHEKG
jgi:uncharacterized protein